MTEGLKGIIAQLEHQKAAIERALAALREVEAPASQSSIPPERRGGMTPEGRKRISAALKKRWAAKRAAEGAPAETPQKAVRRKSRLTPEGRQRLAEAMKRRWGIKRAASAVKKTARRKRAVEKAA
jgi:hypothetical protein